MKQFDVYFHQKKIRYRQDHELFYQTLTGQCDWMETVAAETTKEAFQIAARQHYYNCVMRANQGAILSPAALNPKFMYIEDVGYRNFVPCHSTTV